MKLVKAAGALCLATLAVFSSPWALAQDSGWYAGANLGSASTSIDGAKINSGLVGNWFNSSTTVKDEHSTGYKVFGGYRLDKNFALEGGYFDLGSFGYTATTVPAGTLNGTIKITGLNLDLVGTMPLNEKFSAFGRVGLNYAHTRDSFSSTGAVLVGNPNPSKSDANYKLGLGLQYALTESLAVRAELERYRVNDALGSRGNIDLVSAGLIYRFGDKAQAPTPKYK